MFVYGKGDGHHRDVEKVVRVHENGPAHLFPLHEESRTVGVLLLNDPDHLQLAVVL